MENAEYIEIVKKGLKKEYGEEGFVSAQDILDDPLTIIPWSPSVNLALSGGIPEGTWVSFNGPPKTGKSVSSLSFAAMCQRPEYGSRTVYYIDVEHRLKEKHLKGIEGLDTSPDKLVIIKSTKDKIYSQQDFLCQTELILKTHPKCLIIIDSISALADSKEQIGGVGTETRGHSAKVLSGFVNNVANVVPVMKQIVLGITHRIANTSGFGSPTQEKSCNRWIYQADVRIRIKKSLPWKVGGREIGKEMTIQVEESALGPPNMECTSFIRYGKGVDRLYENLQMAISCGLVVPSGAWYKVNFMLKYPELLKGTEWEGKDKISLSGQDGAYQFFNNNPAFQAKMEEEVKQFASMLVGGGSEE